MANTRQQNRQDAAPAPDAPELDKDVDTQEPSSDEYVVLTGALTLKLDADSKKVRRYYRGDVVPVDPKIHDIERLVEIKAIGRKGDRIPTAAGLSVAAAQANQATPPVPVDSGAVAQAEGPAKMDDGGAGSDDTTPPAEQ